MRILWWGIGPWHKTGYGRQADLFTTRIAGLGHQVAVGWMGRKGTDDTPGRNTAEAWQAISSGRWKGLPLIGPGPTQFGLPPAGEIRAAFGGHNPDLILILKDAWVLTPEDYRPWPTALWTVFDCEPLGIPDQKFFTAAPEVQPVAVSRWGQVQLRKEGFDPGYVPHGYDPAVFRPPADKAGARLRMPAGWFVVGLNASNSGQIQRKAFAEQFAGFAAFHAKHPKSLLLCHTEKRHPEGIDLEALAIRKGIRDVVVFDEMTNLTPGQMAAWYGACDVVLNATMGEGFGIPIIEAMACGVPVIATRCSNMTELIRPGTGWLVKPVQPFWHPHHLSDWQIPSIAGITAALEKAWRARPDVGLLTAAAAEYDADRVTREHWGPWLDAWKPPPPPAIRLTSKERRGLPPARARSLAVLVPSRGRPANVARLVAAVKDTAQGDTRLIFGFDDDDPELEANLAAADGAQVITGQRKGLAGTTNDLAAAVIGDYDALASLGDDHVPVTAGWDIALMKALGDGGFAYPNDMIRDDIPEAVVISSKIVAALGWMCQPSLRHWYVDNAWADLGRAAGCLAYLPDVIVKHERLGVPDDDTYRDAWPLVADDEGRYKRWRAERMAADVETVKVAISNNGEH